MMKLYLAIVASLLTPAHGAAVDVLDTPKNRRALREDWEKGLCKQCLEMDPFWGGGSLAACDKWGAFYTNCQIADKNFEWTAPEWTSPNCDTCKNDFKKEGGCPSIEYASCPITPEYCYGGKPLDYRATITKIGNQCWACLSPITQKLKDFCTVKASDPAPSSSPSPSPPPSGGGGGGGGGGGDDPCFSRDTYACRLLDPKAPAAEAYAQCFLGAAGDAATRALMSELAAGDTVLSDADTAARVVVNQHKVEDGKASLLITLTHARGSLALTPDHVLELDGKFMPAREAHVGAALSNGAVIEAISHSRGGIINPVTVTGKILAAAATGEPVVAATGNEWLADVMLSAYPKYTLSYALAAAFPAAVQAYYDGALEPLFTAAVPHLTKIKAAAPAPLVGVILVAGDAALATGFAAYSLGLKGVATLAVIAVAAARKGKKP